MVDFPADLVILFISPLAPLLVVGVLWVVQLFFIDTQKRLLQSLRHRHEPLCRFTNFVGIVFQSICQALGYTVTHSGIAEFRLSVSEARVVPKKEREGFGGWVASSFLFFGPFLIPAGLVVLASVFLVSTGLGLDPPASFSFETTLVMISQAMASYGKAFMSFLVHLDLFNPVHAGFLLLLLFLGLGIRPSYLGGKHKEPVDMFTDLRHFRDLLLFRPRYLVGILLILYVFFAVSFVTTSAWYLAFFAVLGWVSLVAIFALVITALLLLFIRATDEVDGPLHAVPFLTIPVSYVALRGVFLVVTVDNVAGLSLLGTIVATLVVTGVLLRTTNRFKPSTSMRRKRVSDAKERLAQKRDD